MKREKIYLDTSVVSAYFDKRLKQRQEDTGVFFKTMVPHYEVYVSEITIRELSETKNAVLREKFLRTIKGFKVLRINPQIGELAEKYIKDNVFPRKYFDDALHIAVASYYKMSCLVSWNFEHIVKVKTRRLVNFENKLNSLGTLEIVSPLEL
ncbi:MAG: type II toxin-antitoxin system VapC family toxin [Candidatus Omnitrophota bacterium]|nr:type II toxin-antitoxin system VapC family toxin [Candidatus Omnitrophota bacterium]